VLPGLRGTWIVVYTPSGDWSFLFRHPHGTWNKISRMIQTLRSPEPGARSPEPGARSPEPGARSPEWADYYRILLRVGRRRGWDPEIAAEAAQRTIVDWFRRGHDVEVPPPPILFRRLRGHAAKALSERIPSLGDRAEEIPESRSMEWVCLREEVQNLLHRLPERERRIVEWHYLEGWSREQILQETGMTSENLRIVLHRAKCRLRAGFRL